MRIDELMEKRIGRDNYQEMKERQFIGETIIIKNGFGPLDPNTVCEITGLKFDDLKILGFYVKDYKNRNKFYTKENVYFNDERLNILANIKIKKELSTEKLEWLKTIRDETSETKFLYELKNALEEINEEDELVDETIKHLEEFEDGLYNLSQRYLKGLK